MILTVNDYQLKNHVDRYRIVKKINPISVLIKFTIIMHYPGLNRTV